MSGNRLVLGAVVGLIISSLAGGAYLASRNAEAPSSVQMAAKGDDFATATIPGNGAVHETEQRVTEPSEVTVQSETVKPAEKADASAHVSAQTAASPPTVASARPASRRAPSAATAPTRSGSRTDTRTEPEGWSGLDRTWPSAKTSQPSAESAPSVEAAAPVITTPVPSVERRREYEDLVISADSVIGISLETSLSTETAQIEDSVDGRIARDVRVGSRVAIPAGTRVRGSVTLVERGGKVKERARLGIRFHTVVLADGAQVPLQTETIYREGESPAGESSAKIGGAAAGGAILGAILGGKKGAAIGGAIGGAGGTAAVMAGARNPATLPSGTTVTVRVLSPTTVTVERDNN